MLADRDAVCRVFANLIGNAVKFTPEHGRVTVRSVRDGDAVRFAVSDTGPGIAEAELPHVFEAFRRVGLSKEAVPGVGLGLFVVKRIVEMHEGGIEVESALGVGSTFRVRLPRVTTAAAAPELPESELRAVVH